MEKHDADVRHWLVKGWNDVALGARVVESSTQAVAASTSHQSQLAELADDSLSDKAEEDILHLLKIFLLMAVW